MLAEIAVVQAAEGKVLVEVGPVQAERGEFDAVELRGRAARETRVLRDGEAEFPSPARASLFPEPIFLFHSSLPAVEMASTTRSSPSDEVR